MILILMEQEEVIMKLWLEGTFANIRIKNMMVDKVGGYTKHYPSNFEGEIFEISEKYKKKVCR